MNGIHSKLSGFLFMTVTILIFAVPCNCQQTYYCDNGNVIDIQNEPDGTIITREAGNDYYGDNLNCRWLIDAGSSNRVKLTFTTVKLQWSSSYASCSGFDHLSVRNGASQSADLLMQVCHSINPYQLVSHGQYLYLHFTSDDKNFYQHPGIILEFETFDKSSCPPGWRNLSMPNSCYSLMTQPQSGTTYELAQQYCGYSNSNLVKIGSIQLFDEIQDYDQSVTSISKAWVGLHDLLTEGTYIWLDGSEFTLPEKMDKFTGSEDKDCVAYNFDTGKLEVLDCESELAFICAKARIGDTVVYNVPAEADDDTVAGNVTVVWAIILAIIVGIVCVAVVVIFWCCCKRQKSSFYASERRNQQRRETRNDCERSGSAASLNSVPVQPTAPPINLEGSTTLVWDYGPAPPSYEESLQHNVVKD